MNLSEYEALVTQPLPDSVDECIALLEKIKAAIQSPTLSFTHISVLNTHAQKLGNHAKTLLYHTQHDNDSFSC
ncbi:MAG: hypothetical protein NZL83_03960 [Candidatus Absconditabacterales bacterium]|nr:hypothetical protein [Candidatus Absconditabacterales bacterium]